MKVQDDLQYLRAAANRGFAADDSDKSTDLKTVDMVIARTEQGIQAVAERVLQSTHDHISTLPAVARKGKTKDMHIRHKKHRWVFISVTTTPTKLLCRRTRSYELPDLSAGQFCLVKQMGHLVGQPTNPLTSKMLADYYNLPSKEQDDNISIPVPGQILVGSTINHLTTLPKPNRKDPLVGCSHEASLTAKS